MHSFSFGASYEERGVTDNAAISRVDNVITFTRNELGITSNVIRDVVAFYLQDQMKFGENLKLTLGLRYDDYSDFGDTVNPRGALIYSTPFKGKFKLMYGQAFRAPSNSELFTINSLAAWGNTDLQPEQVKTFEVAYNQSFQKINFTMTYFDNTFTDNIITTANPNPPPDVIFVNQEGETESSGIELEFTASPVKGFFIRGSYTASDNNDEWSPENYGSLILNYNTEKWNFNVNGTWHDEVDKVPGQGNVSILNSSFKFNIFEKTNLQLTAINLTDENSLSPDAPFTDDGLVVERRGRTLTLAVNFDF
jgi:iron complex outermembrane receptor protein